MVTITVSNDNYMKVVSARDGEEIRIEHMNIKGSVSLIKQQTIKRMTVAQIEEELGYHIEIIGGERY